MNRWPTRLAIAEGLENARCGGWVSWLVTLAVSSVLLGIGVSSTLEVNAMVQAERAWIDAGALVMVAEAAGGSGPGIDIDACEQLARAEGISAAFAATLTESSIEAENAPGTLTTLMKVSPGIFGFTGVESAGSATILAVRKSAAPMAVGDNESVVFTIIDDQVTRTRFTAVTKIVSRSDLGPNLEDSLLMPALLSGTANSCYVRVEPGYEASGSTYIAQALAAPGGEPAVIRSLLSGNSFGLDFRTAYAKRILQWAWLFGGMALGGLWLLVQRTRRTRNAIYQTFGAHLRARFAMQFTQWLALSLPGLAYGWAMATLVAIAFQADPEVLLWQISFQVIAAWCTGSLTAAAVALIPAGSLFDALKDHS